jgi:hypothetical protein
VLSLLAGPHSCASSCTCRSAARTSWLMDSVDRKGWCSTEASTGARKREPVILSCFFRILATAA